MEQPTIQARPKRDEVLARYGGARTIRMLPLLDRQKLGISIADSLGRDEARKKVARRVFDAVLKETENPVNALDYAIDATAPKRSSYYAKQASDAYEEYRKKREQLPTVEAMLEFANSPSNQPKDPIALAVSDCPETGVLATKIIIKQLLQLQHPSLRKPTGDPERDDVYPRYISSVREQAAEYGVDFTACVLELVRDPSAFTYFYGPVVAWRRAEREANPDRLEEEVDWSGIPVDEKRSVKEFAEYFSLSKEQVAVFLDRVTSEIVQQKPVPFRSQTPEGVYLLDVLAEALGLPKPSDDPEYKKRIEPEIEIGQLVNDIMAGRWSSQIDWNANGYASRKKGIAQLAFAELLGKNSETAVWVAKQYDLDEAALDPLRIAAFRKLYRDNPAAAFKACESYPNSFDSYSPILPEEKLGLYRSLVAWLTPEQKQAVVDHWIKTGKHNDYDTIQLAELLGWGAEAEILQNSRRLR